MPGMRSRCPPPHRSLVEKINKKHKTANVKPFMVKNHVWLFVNANIENPAFDSQTKENLTLRASAFGSKCDVTGPFADKVGVLTIPCILVVPCRT